MPFTGRGFSRADVNAFVNQVWAMEVRRYRDSNFVMQEACKMMSFVGRKGDTLDIPLVPRMGVYPKVELQEVVLQNRSPGTYRMSIDQHNESSFAIGDIAKLQSQYNIRSNYVRECGYALRRDLDNALLALRAAIPAEQQIFVSTTATAAGVPQDLSYEAILGAKLTLLRADVPESDLRLIVGPETYMQLLNIDRFISNDFVDGRPVTTGVVGKLSNIPVIMTTNLKPNSLIGYVNGDGAAPQPTPGVANSPYLPTQDPVVGNGLPRGQTGNEVAQPFISSVLCHKDWAIMAKQLNMTAEYDRVTTHLMDVIVHHHVYGAKLYRSDHAVLLHSRAAA